MDVSHEIKLSELILLHLQGDNSLQEHQQLVDILNDDAEAVEFYVEYMMQYSALYHSENIVPKDYSKDSSASVLDSSLWEALSRYEMEAPTMEIPQEKSQLPLVHTVFYPPKEKRKISKFSVITLLNVAAVVLFFLILRAVPPKGGFEVAALSDSLNAQWANTNAVPRIGDRLVAGDNLFLSAGLIEVLFDNGARVVLEAPAEFRILAEDRIGLTYGKVYATVPEKAIGFSVYTLNAKIIDMGTEFGVEADLRGDTQLHVLEGKTALIVGQDDNTVNVGVGKGQARNVSGSTQIVTEIPLHENYFVRAFNSTNNIVWRRQRSLDLADIVRNGNGLGTGNSQARLDYIKGFTAEQRGGETRIARGYLPIEDHPFIDGIFIPDGRAVVSSRGDVFDGFVITSGVHCSDLYADPAPESFFIDGQWKTIQFDGQEYSQQGKSCIVMSGSNHGITFDLDAIRSRYNLKIDQFTSHVGLADFGNKRCNANFYVLVDGQPRYSLLAYQQKGVLNSVSVKLEPTDRFLTLATTENVDQIDYMAHSTLRENWCVFTEPALIFEQVEPVQH